jgi:hypothetical protein
VLDKVSTRLIDGVGYIRVQFVGIATLDIAKVLQTAKPTTALVAVLAAKMVFVSASSASSGHFATRHGNERPIASLDDL